MKLKSVKISINNQLNSQKEKENYTNPVGMKDSNLMNASCTR